MKQGTLQLNNGSQINIEVEQDEGFIKEIKIDNSSIISPEDYFPQFIEALKWVQINPVALYTRIRFFTLKNNVELVGVDANNLAQAISRCL